MRIRRTTVMLTILILNACGVKGRPRAPESPPAIGKGLMKMIEEQEREEESEKKKEDVIK